MNIEQMSDLEVVMMLNEAKDDLSEAGEKMNETEWHQACFAAVVILRREVIKRGLVVGTVH